MSTGAFLVPKRQEGKRSTAAMLLVARLSGCAAGHGALTDGRVKNTRSGLYSHGGGARLSPIQLFNADSLVIKHIQSSTLTHCTRTLRSKTETTQRTAHAISTISSSDAKLMMSPCRPTWQSPQHNKYHERLWTRIQVTIGRHRRYEAPVSVIKN